MADNVAVTPGSGANIATDDVGGVQFQKVKIDGGGNGLSDPITAITPADATANQAALPVAGLMMGRTAAAGTWESLRVSNTTSDAMVGHAAGVLDVQAHNTVYNGTTWDRLRGDTTNGVDVDVTRLPALVAGTANIGDVDVLTVPAPLSTTGGGVEATALRVTLASDSTGVVSIDDNGASLTVDGTVTANAGTGSFTVAQATASNLNAQIVGSVAHDAVDSGNPVKIGGIARQANPTAVAALDRVDAFFDDVGRQVVVMGQARDLMTHQHTQIASSSAETTILTAVASTFLDLTQLVITNQTATAVNVTIKDATAGTTRMIVALAASGGAIIPFPRPVGQAAVNNNWTATLSSAAVTVNIFAQAEKNV